MSFDQCDKILEPGMRKLLVFENLVWVVL